jgi:hypothetical protein
MERADELISSILEGTGVRGWLDPDNNFHELESRQLHHAWITKNAHKIKVARRAKGVEPTQDSMLKAGWARIANNSVDVHEKHHARVLKFLKDYPSDEPPDIYVHKGDGDFNIVR